MDLSRVSKSWVGNTWTDTDAQRAYVRRDFETVSRWARENGRKVVLGEFGVSTHADLDPKVRWTRLVRQEAESRGMIRIFWQLRDVGTLGVLYNQQEGTWRKEALDALLPQKP